MDTTVFKKPETDEKFQEYYRRLRQANAGPLWEVLGDIVPHKPKPQCVPAMWRYEEMRPLLMEAGELITAREAERRVILLENPGIPGQSRITQSLYAGLQLVLPGEDAPTHRHAPSALRFVIESDGGYTAVDGERITMYPGDFILTPSFTFHDHGNPGSGPVIWMDGLDIPIVNFFDAGFAERYPGEEIQPVTRPEGDGLARYGSNMVPLEFKPKGLAPPLVTYRYARAREVLDQIHHTDPLHPCHGTKLQYLNPITGGHVMRTIGAFLQFLPKGFQGALYRSTDATVFCAVEGRGRTRVGDTTLAWKERDIFVAPSWYPVSHEAEDDAVLFSYSDRPVQKALGLWREEELVSR